MIDITGSDDINIGDTLIILGCDGGKCISPANWACAASTIPGEILCAFKIDYLGFKSKRHFD